VDFARHDGEIDIVIGTQAAKRLDDVAGFKKRVRFLPS
jgi:hypothetical protein